MTNPTNRFFRVPATVYEQVRAGLDAEWQHPNGRADTCMVPSDQAVRDGDDVLCAVHIEMCEWPSVATTIAQLLASETITEITETDYFAALPTPDDP
jgi:hypothetical protein